MSKNGRRCLRTVTLVLLTALLSACSSVSYYAQAASGQVALLIKRQPLTQVLSDPAIDPELARQLGVISDALLFAEQTLGLAANGSYSSYVNVDRPHLVWNVFAAPAFAVEPLSWCFPVAGCVSYRGYFSEAGARAYADRLAKRGYDVYVGGVDAYSTLGWFKDPIPSTILSRPDHRLVSLIFHELAHQRIYVAGDTVFNESFASFVEQEGLRRWLSASGDSETFDRYTREQQLSQAFVDFVADFQGQFAALYGSGQATEEKKQALQQQMRQQWRAENGDVVYRGWFDGPLNNAQLATVAAYNALLPSFEQMLNQAEGDLEAFYRQVQQVAAMPLEQRHQSLMALKNNQPFAVLSALD